MVAPVARATGSSRRPIIDAAPIASVKARMVRLTEEAAVLNLRLAIAMAGHQPTVTLLPGEPRSDAVAVVRRVQA